MYAQGGDIGSGEGGIKHGLGGGITKVGFPSLPLPQQWGCTTTSPPPPPWGKLGGGGTNPSPGLLVGRASEFLRLGSSTPGDKTDFEGWMDGGTGEERELGSHLLLMVRMSFLNACFNVKEQQRDPEKYFSYFSVDYARNTY